MGDKQGYGKVMTALFSATDCASSNSPVEENKLTGKDLSSPDLVRAAETLARLVGSPEPLGEREAEEALNTLCQIPGRGLVEFTNDPARLRDAWNRSRHLFVGSLPALAMEESVYKAWTADESHPLAGKTGRIWGDPAVHMAGVMESFGMAPDPAKAMAPDHLAILLDFLTFLIENRPASEVTAFCNDHLDWLPALRQGAEERDMPAVFADIIGAVEDLVNQVLSK